MKILKSHLDEKLGKKKNVGKLSDQLTMLGLEVDSITKIKTEQVNDKSLIKKIKLKKGTEAIILLDEKGEVVTTDKFKHLLFETSLSKILFVIGGTDGFSKEINNLCNKRISLSKMTLTHSFAAIILLEQIYRSVTIKINHPYHRA